MSIKAIVGKLFAAYPNTKVTEATVLIYLERLGQIPVAELEVVVNQIIDEPGSFIPSSGDIIEKWKLAHVVTMRASAASEAWIGVLVALKSVPATPLADPIAKRVVEALGGISEIRRSERPAVDRAHFLKLYDAYVLDATNAYRYSPEYAALREHSLLEIEDKLGHSHPEGAELE